MMIEFVLFLYLFTVAGEQANIIRFESYSTMQQCESVKAHLEESHAGRLEGLCLKEVHDD